MEGTAHNPPAPKQQRDRGNNPGSSSNAIAHKTSMGFNLIEAAIVLGVVGLVIGGIWIGAKAAIQSHSLNRTSAFMVSLATDLQNKWKDVRWDTHPEPYYPISSCAADAGLIPDDFINPNGYDDCISGYQNSVYPYKVSHPWVTNNGAGVAISFARAERMYIACFIGLPTAVCRKLSAQVTASVGKNSQLVSAIRVDYGATVTSDTFPVPLENIPECTIACFYVPF